MSDLSLAKELIRKCQETQNPYLELGKCGIKNLNDLPELFECTHLETLILSDYYWTDALGRDQVVSENNGENNEIRYIPSCISRLKNLKKFSYTGGELSGYITNIISLSKLKGLVFLDLRFNFIENIEPIKNLKKIESLYLYDNNIRDFSPLTSVKSLKSLDIGANPSKGFNFLKSLPGLRHLSLNSIELKDIDFLNDSQQLQELNLENNYLTDISILGKLTSISYLILRDNNISDISSLANLRKLESLDINKNKVKTLPLTVVQFVEDIHMNSEFHKKGISLYNNPLESPPLEILKQGTESVLDWFEANKKKLDEIKVILIGDAKAGKTSLLKRLKENSFDENEVQTDGINIQDINFGECETFKKQNGLHHLTGHFWDFGGQEIMNATHQFFLTNRSVYILVLDARKDVKVSTQIRDWVRRIKATGGNSSIIVVANQIDINPGFGFDNEYELKKDFPQIKYFVKTSCKEGSEIETLKTQLSELIPQAELFNTEIDERWIKVKDKLQKDTKQEHFLNEDKFLEICDEFELRKREGQKNAIAFLHDLGIVLNFKEVKAYDYYVLDPYWITYGVYQILTSAYVGKNNGLVDMDKLDFIINEEEDKNQSYRSNNYKKITYSNNQRRFLVDILNQFKLSFYLPERSHFIIPDLLDTAEPIEITEPIRQNIDSVRFIYGYSYLPNSVMPHFMVETHLMHQEMWRTGCVLTHDGCQALVTAYQNKISIWVTGDHKKKREFMSVIRNRINLINLDLSDKPSMLIPLPGTNQHVDYEELLEREKDGEKSYTLYKPEKKKFRINTLLEGIASEKEVSNKDLLKELQDIKAGVITIKDQLNSHFEYLIELPTNKEIKNSITETIDILNSNQAEAASHELMHFIVEALKIQKDSIDDRLNQVYYDLQKTDDFQLKLKLGTPLARELGVGIEGEFDVKNWAKKMYEKHELKIFKLFGWVE
ncbi:MAG: GTP-binding protein [Roseivirga sp.]|nr:GTP-binding protein [Roseivirga sp.]